MSKDISQSTGVVNDFGFQYCFTISRMNGVVTSIRRSTKICKAIAKSGAHKLKNKLIFSKERFIKRLYRGYYADRIVRYTKRFIHRFMFGSLSLAIAIVEPTEKQKSAFMEKMRETYSKCSKRSRDDATDEFEQCKACKSQLKSYLRPLDEDIKEGYHLRQDVVAYIANFCGIEQHVAIDFLLSVDQNDDLIQELCKWMSPCKLSGTSVQYMIFDRMSGMNTQMKQKHIRPKNRRKDSNMI